MRGESSGDGGMTEPVVRVEGLTAWYAPGRPVISIDSLNVPAHSVVGLLGMNGAGKTTLLNCLSNVHEGFRVGRVTGLGGVEELTTPTFMRRRYAVFTESQGFRFWTFTRYLAFLEKVYETPVRVDLVEHLVEGFGFSEWRDRRIASLSTGSRKKVFLIAGLALRLPLLLLDEPSDALDFESTEFLYDAINDYRDAGSILMSSHVAESFQRCCDLTYVLKDGGITGPFDTRGACDVRRLAGLD